MSEKVITRDFDPEKDKPFIIKSWRDSLWFDNNPTIDGRDRTDESHDFYRKVNKEIKNIIANSIIKIAYSPNEPDFIYGYSVTMNHTLVWIYVKIDYRLNGIAKLLCKDAQRIGEPKTKVGIDVKDRLEIYIKARTVKIKKSDRVREVSEPLPAGEGNGASL
jgi:hypothetical protein